MITLLLEVESVDYFAFKNYIKKNIVQFNH